jgi:hypothetical protein
LYLKVDTERVQCLNEVVDGSAKTVFKPWHERLDKEKYVESDVDDELLFIIPFTGTVKLKGVIVIGGESDSHPSSMKLFKNRPQMTFDECTSEPDQEFDLQPDLDGSLEYATNIARFNSVSSLSIYFPKNFGCSENCPTKVYYIGLKGDFMEPFRQEVVVATYEARANVADHKNKLCDSVTQEIT